MTSKIVSIEQLELLSKRVTDLAAEVSRKEQAVSNVNAAKADVQDKLDETQCEVESLRVWTHKSQHHSGQSDI